VSVSRRRTGLTLRMRSALEVRCYIASKIPPTTSPSIPSPARSVHTANSRTSFPSVPFFQANPTSTKCVSAEINKKKNTRTSMRGNYNIPKTIDPCRNSCMCFHASVMRIEKPVPYAHASEVVLLRRKPGIPIQTTRSGRNTPSF
jgi:hypothetical protein